MWLRLILTMSLLTSLGLSCAQSVMAETFADNNAEGSGDCKPQAGTSRGASSAAMFGSNSDADFAGSSSTTESMGANLVASGSTAMSGTPAVAIGSTVSSGSNSASSGSTAVANDSTAASSGSTAVANSSNSASLSASASADVVYQDLRTMWNHCNNMKSTALDLLNEGRNAPARQKWVTFYVSSAKDDLAILKSTVAALQAPADLKASMGTGWAEVQGDIDKLAGIIPRLDAEAQGLKAPTDDKYPPVFWKTSSEFSRCADDLDKGIISIFNALDASLSKTKPALSSGLEQIDSSSSKSDTALQGSARMVNEQIGFKKIGEASTKISKACWGLFGELERWNLLYGKPPAGGIPDGFYGGGLSSSEVVSEYKYLPQFTFTNAPYVMLYSYRLPPRQNMLAYHTGQIGKLLNLMETELNDVQVPADRQEALAGPWDQTKKLFLDCRQNYLSLLNLVNTTSDDRLSKNIREDQITFGQPLMAIYGDMAKMRDSLNDINKMVQ